MSASSSLLLFAETIWARLGFEQAPERLRVALSEGFCPACIGPLVTHRMYLEHFCIGSGYYCLQAYWRYWLHRTWSWLVISDETICKHWGTPEVKQILAGIDWEAEGVQSIY